MINYLSIFGPIILLDYATYFILYAFSISIIYCYLIGKMAGLISFFFLGTHGSLRNRSNQFFIFLLLFLMNMAIVYAINNYVEKINGVIVYKIIFDLILFVINFYAVKALGFKSRIKFKA